MNNLNKTIVRLINYLYNSHDDHLPPQPKIVKRVDELAKQSLDESPNRESDSKTLSEKEVIPEEKTIPPAQFLLFSDKEKINEIPTNSTPKPPTFQEEPVLSIVPLKTEETQEKVKIPTLEEIKTAIDHQNSSAEKIIFSYCQATTEGNLDTTFQELANHLLPQENSTLARGNTKLTIGLIKLLNGDKEQKKKYEKLIFQLYTNGTSTIRTNIQKTNPELIDKNKESIATAKPHEILDNMKTPSVETKPILPTPVQTQKSTNQSLNNAEITSEIKNKYNNYVTFIRREATERGFTIDIVPGNGSHQKVLINGPDGKKYGTIIIAPHGNTIDANAGPQAMKKIEEVAELYKKKQTPK